jgi:hypothetical protein
MQIQTEPATTLANGIFCKKSRIEITHLNILETPVTQTLGPAFICLLYMNVTDETKILYNKL